ncbi:glycosyltransferase family 2 protein [Microbacterium sp. P03]|uniref:glycosyltransferase family 2 protein n=1 Tax=Microbacterium sp. P03 TaxID=3366946 RepID=UPI00374655FB
MAEPKIVVAVPTFKRPQALDSLLTALREQTAGLPARVLVIDNDPDGSASEVCARHEVTYVREPSAGLAAVRNRALDESPAEDALAFIDDDELPGAGWLPTLVERWMRSGATAVSGRVESRFPEGFDDPWIRAGGFFTRIAFDDGAHQPFAPTNNLLLDLAFTREHSLRFDSDFGMSGGEDILFTTQIVAAGGTIVSCPAALVYDDVAADRLNRSWVLRRAYRVGISTVRADLVDRHGLARRARWIARGAARLAAGSGRWLWGSLSRSDKHEARGARAAARGAGMVMAAFGADYAEYAHRR